jgi:hypothetical protein
VLIPTNLNLTANHPMTQFSIAPPNPLLDWIPQQQRDADIGRIDDLLQRNRQFDAMVKKDTALCIMLFPGQLLSPDEGKVLAGAMVMVASGTSAYETEMVEIQCCVNLLASKT